MGRPIIKTSDEIRAMRAAGRIASKVLRGAAQAASPGMTTSELDARVGQLIASHGAVSAFLGYRGFPAQCCLSVNAAVIHGIGDSRRLQFGDLLKIDVGVRYQGFIGDVAMTVMVGGGSPQHQKLLDTTVQALYEGISAARAGSRVMDIGRAVEILDDGWTVVTRDRQVSAHFEHTVLITDSGPEILTRDEESQLY